MKKNSVRIYNPLSKPFGPLSINYFYPIYVEDKKAYPIQIKSRQYKTASNYIYSNGILTSPMYNNVIANAKPVDIKNLFKEFIIEDIKNARYNSLVEAIEYALKSDRDFNIEISNVGAKTLRYSNKMEDEIDVFLDKNYLNTIYKYVPELKTSSKFEDRLYEAYKVSQFLLNRISNNSALTEYIGKSPKDILPVSLNYPSKDSVLILYNSGKIEPYIYENVNTPENIVHIIRANELKNLQTRLKLLENERIFQSYVDDFLKRNNPELDEINYNIAKNQQFRTMSDDEYKNMVSRVVKLVKAGIITGLKYEKIKIPTDKEIKKAIDRIKDLIIREEMSPEKTTMEAPFSSRIKPFMVEYMKKVNKNLSKEVIVSKLKENMMNIFDLKFQNNEFRYLLTLTGSFSIQMPDLYEKDNFVGEYLEQLRSRLRLDFTPITKDNIHIHIEGNKFLMDWVKERTLDICNTSVMIQKQFVEVDQKIIKPFVNAVLENVYNKCDALPVKLSYDVPAYFNNIVKNFSKRMDVDINEKTVKFIYNYILQLIFTIIDTTDVKSLEQFNKNIALSQHFLTVKPNMICVKSALINLVEQIGEITGENDYDRYLLVAVDILYNKKNYVDDKLRSKIKELEKEISNLVEEKKESKNIYEIESEIDKRVIELNNANKEFRKIIKNVQSFDTKSLRTQEKKSRKDEDESDYESDLEKTELEASDDEEEEEEISFSFPYKRSSAAYRRSKTNVKFEDYVPKNEEIIDNLRVLPNDKFEYVIRKMAEYALSEPNIEDESKHYRKAISEYVEPIQNDVIRMVEKIPSVILSNPVVVEKQFKPKINKKYVNLEKKIDKKIKSLFSSSKSQMRFEKQIKERFTTIPANVQNRINFFAPNCRFILKTKIEEPVEFEDEILEDVGEEEESDEEEFVPEMIEKEGEEREEREGKAEEDIEIEVEDFEDIEF